jgi:hypothetical protein
MGDSILLFGGKLGKGLVVTIRDEERIIAEALDSCRLFGDMPRAMYVDDKFLARRIDERGDVDEARSRENQPSPAVVLGRQGSAP